MDFDSYEGCFIPRLNASDRALLAAFQALLPPIITVLTPAKKHAERFAKEKSAHHRPWVWDLSQQR